MLERKYNAVQHIEIPEIAILPKMYQEIRKFSCIPLCHVVSRPMPTPRRHPRSNPLYLLTSTPAKFSSSPHKSESEIEALTTCRKRGNFSKAVYATRKEEKSQLEQRDPATLPLSLSSPSLSNFRISFCATVIVNCKKSRPKRDGEGRGSEFRVQNSTERRRELLGNEVKYDFAAGRNNGRSSLSTLLLSGLFWGDVWVKLNAHVFVHADTNNLSEMRNRRQRRSLQQERILSRFIKNML